MERDSTHIAIVTPREEQRLVLASMLENYLRELNEPTSYPYLDLYWKDPQRFPYLIQLGNANIGFALVRSTEDGVIEMAEYCVLKPWRNLGWGRVACTKLFHLHPGTWRVRSHAGNTGAARFWRNAVPENACEFPSENSSLFLFSIDCIETSKVLP